MSEAPQIRQRRVLWIYSSLCWNLGKEGVEKARSLCILAGSSKDSICHSGKLLPSEILDGSNSQSGICCVSSCLPECQGAWLFQ